MPHIPIPPKTSYMNTKMTTQQMLQKIQQINAGNIYNTPPVMDAEQIRDIAIEQAKKVFQEYVEQEQQKRKKRIEDRKVITEQMQQREKAKVLEAERVEQENVMMRNKMKKYQVSLTLASPAIKMLEAILVKHSGQKGVIHTSSYKYSQMLYDIYRKRRDAREFTWSTQILEAYSISN